MSTELEKKLFRYASQALSKDPRDRAYAASMLCTCEAEAIPILEKILDDCVVGVRLAAVDSLLNFPQIRAQMAVFKKLLEDDELRVLAIEEQELSARIESCAVVIIEKGSPEEKRNAARLLFNKKLITSLDDKDRPTIPILEQAVKMESVTVRIAAIESLLNLRNIKADTIVVSVLNKDAKLLDLAIRRFSPKIEAAAANVMEHGSMKAKCDAAELLFSINTRESRISLSKAVRREPLIKAIFIMNVGERATGQLDSERLESMRRSMIKCLNDSSPEVRFFAAEALRKLGREAGEIGEIALLMMIKKEENSQVRDMAISALKAIGGNIPRAIEEKIGRPDESTTESRITFLLARRISRQVEEEANECRSKRPPKTMRIQKGSILPGVISKPRLTQRK